MRSNALRDFWENLAGLHHILDGHVAVPVQIAFCISICVDIRFLINIRVGGAESKELAGRISGEVTDKMQTVLLGRLLDGVEQGIGRVKPA